MSVRLHVNIDHVATLRQARGTIYPDPVHAAALCELAGAHGITVHLREDRRHIQDRDVQLLRQTVSTWLNLEMAPTDEMVGIAKAIKPDVVTLVPERREEQTTEGGLDIASTRSRVEDVIRELTTASVPVSVFIDPERRQVDAAFEVSAWGVEFHTGDYANAHRSAHEKELKRIAEAAAHAANRNKPIRVAAGHGLTVHNLGPLLAAVPSIQEVNIGHALISDAVLLGLHQAVRRFLDVIGTEAS